MTHLNDSWNPAQYEKFKSERSQPFFDLMALLQPCKDAHIVDLGCGSGELTRDLHQKLQAEQTLGIDSSTEMLKKASAFAQGGLTFEHANIESWKPTLSFDIVFSNAAIQWCGNHSKLLTQFRQSLRPGGQMAIQMPMNHTYPTHLIAHEMAMEKSWAQKLGLNTALECLANGVPTVAIPLSNDQPGVAARLALNKAGEFIELKKLNSQRLRDLVTKVLHDSTYKQNSERLRRSMANAGGKRRAADLIESAIN